MMMVGCCSIEERECVRYISGVEASVYVTVKGGSYLGMRCVEIGAGKNSVDER